MDICFTSVDACLLRFFRMRFPFLKKSLGAIAGASMRRSESLASIYSRHMLALSHIMSPGGKGS